MSDEIAQVRRHLNEIPELITEVSYYLEPGSAPIDPTSSHGTTVFRIPITPEIFDLLDERDKELDDVMLNRSARDQWWEDGSGKKISEPARLRRLGVLPTLGLWVQLAWAELDDMGLAPRECCPPRQHTVAGEAGWLNEYADPIVELHSDFPRDIELLWLELRKACRIRKEYVPKCPNCGHRIEGVYGAETDEYPAWWRCTGCPKTWVHDAEVKRLFLTQPPMTLRQISGLLEIPLRTLHNWRSARRFSPNSRGLYELSHVQAAAEAVGRETRKASYA